MRWYTIEFKHPSAPSGYEIDVYASSKKQARQNAICKVFASGFMSAGFYIRSVKA